MDFGCLTNCLPFLLPSALALLVAAFSAALKLAQAFLGKYLFLPLDGLPSEVVHFCLVQSFKDFCDLASAITCSHRLAFYIQQQVVEPYGLTILLGLRL